MRFIPTQREGHTIVSVEAAINLKERRPIVELVDIPHRLHVGTYCFDM